MIARSLLFLRGNQHVLLNDKGLDEQHVNLVTIELGIDVVPHRVIVLNGVLLRHLVNDLHLPNSFR